MSEPRTKEIRYAIKVLRECEKKLAAKLKGCQRKLAELKAELKGQRS